MPVVRNACADALLPRASDPKRRRSSARTACDGCEGRGVPEQIVIHPTCRAELVALARQDQREAVALRHARRKLALFGSNLGHPHTSAVRGAAGGLRELRPRAGNSPWRLLYMPGRPIRVLALAPEAQRNPRGFRRAVEAARVRLRDQDGSHAE
ncbi:MAG: type II toxin-antitoxin system RelE/ParE family toxin [Actinomycetota bacterium]